MTDQEEVSTEEKVSRFSSMMKKIDKVLALFLVLILALAINHFFFSSPKVVSFDIKSTTNTFLKQVATLNIDENQKNMMVKRYNLALDSVIKEYEAQNYIVLVKEAVVSNVEDKTADIQRKIAQKMKKKQE
ncbi:hypothetical protein HEMROJRC1_20710 [Rodentibacter sp. JRC1]|uniref:TrbI F-type domain-containing protein n=1 Tax=Rodentibacter sp. JRC1 TaxID=2874504 RepID=UPI001CFEF6E1|nr:TrbI F-type domain-containing protein [Rodentibacter sp. JRC1]GJI56959.1 hypothetical protein HEMROJRC1_20710 [Rodentibacter sp. JRC1]